MITLLCLLIASVWDLRSREVPDFLSYILVGSICMIALYHGAYTQLGAAAVLFIIGWALVYGGAWGGADAKLLPLFAFITVPFSLEYFLILPVLFTVGALYGIVWVTCITLYHYQGILAWLSTQRSYWLLSIPVILFTFYLSWPLSVALLTLILFTFAISYLHTCEFSQSVHFQDVVPGDWLMEPLKVGTLKFDGLVTEKECRKIHLLGYQGKITNVQVKYGIPFIPAFFITYIVYLCKDYLLTLM